MQKRNKPSKKMRKARALRIKIMTLKAVAKEMGCTSAGVRWLLAEGDKFYPKKEQIGTYRKYMDFIRRKYSA